MPLGLSKSIASTSGGDKYTRSYIKDNLKLYMPYRGADNSEVQFVGTGSTYFVTNDYISCGNDSSLQFGTGDFSVSVWVKRGAVGAVHQIAGYGDDDGIHWYLGYHSDNKLRFRTDDTSTDTSTYSSSTVADTNWHHIAVTCDRDGDTKFYIDGSLDNTTDHSPSSSTLTHASDPFLIGARNSGGSATQPFNGSIKNVAIWNRALTATEVQNVMYKQYNEIPTSSRLTDGLVSWWSLDAKDSLGSELMTNGDIEDGAPTFGTLTNTRCTSESSTAQKYGGSNSFLVTEDGSTSTNFYTRFAGTGLTNTKPYQGEVWVYLPSGQTTDTITLYQKVNNGEILYDSTTVTDTWTKLSTGAFTVIGHVSDWYMAVRGVESGGGSVGSGDIYYWDDMSFKEVKIEDLKGSNDGTVYGATIDDDLYGSDTPVIPRAIDNAPTVQADAIGSGSALFDGVTDYIVSGDNTGISGASARTLSAWAKAGTTSQDNYAMIVVIGEGDTRKGMWFGADGSSANWMFSFWGAGDDYDTGVALDTNWHHFDLTLDSGSYVGYIDGVAIVSGSTSGAINTTNSKLYVGRHLTNTNRWEGNICQVGIWSSALTQEQIQSIMEKTYAELTASEKEDLVSWWGLDSTVTNDANFNSSAFVVDEHDTTFGNNITPTWSVGVGSATIDGQVIILPEAGTNSVAGSVGSAGVFKVNVTITNYTGSGSIEMPWNGSGSSNMQITANGTYEYYENTNSSTLYIYAVDGRGCTTTVNSIVKADGNMGDLL